MPDQIVPLDKTASPDSSKERIGLALSGGGFRASIFHLGAIRRLEELQIMKDVDVISSVSGGSILAAFYVCEMEEQLRQYPSSRWQEPAVRIAAHQAVAQKFLKAVDLNMRSRALVFTPFYHPLLFLKALFLRPFREDARSILIQKEYDKHFYHDNTLDQLPSVVPKRVTAPGKPVLTGPKLLLNTTSLMTGERTAFSRDANTRLAELKTSNKNVLKLSRVVGASSGVPVLFPPTSVCGELLVDGGVSDNQGIEGLLEGILRPHANGIPQGPPKREPHPCDDADNLAEEEPEADGGDLLQYLLISDASGQLELKHRLSTSSVSVLSRVNDILQHQVRNKLLELVESAYHARKICFAFIHLLLNLKDAGIDRRVPSEYIQGIARIRTDLDQFSYVEREALMYHGYTLIDAMVCHWCSKLIKDRFGSVGRRPPLQIPPLFPEVQDDKKRELIIRELVAGSQKVFLARSWMKYPRWAAAVCIPGAIVALALILLLFAFPDQVFIPTRDAIRKYLLGPLPTNLLSTLDVAAKWLALTQLSFAIGAVQNFVNALVDRAAELAAVLVVVALPIYGITFFVWAALRRLVLWLDRSRYRYLAGPDATPGSLDWKVPAADDRPSPPEPERA